MQLQDQDIMIVDVGRKALAIARGKVQVGADLVMQGILQDAAQKGNCRGPAMELVDDNCVTAVVGAVNILNIGDAVGSQVDTPLGGGLARIGSDNASVV